MTCYQVLRQAGLHKMFWGVSITEAEKCGRFSELDKRCIQFMWPFDEEFAEAVTHDRIGLALIRLIRIEKSIEERALALHRGRDLKT